MISKVRVIELFVIVMLIRLATSPLDIVVSIPPELILSISWLTPLLAFSLSYLVVTHNKRNKVAKPEWAVVAGITMVGFVPADFAIPLLMTSLLLLGWVMHVSGRTLSG
jgi:hypothetical protein